MKEKEKKNRGERVRDVFVCTVLSVSVAIMVGFFVYIIRTAWQINIPLIAASSMEELKEMLSHETEIIYPDMSYLEKPGVEIVFNVYVAERRFSEGTGYEIGAVPLEGEENISLYVTCYRDPIERYEEIKEKLPQETYSGVEIYVYAETVENEEDKLTHLRYFFELGHHWYYVIGYPDERAASRSSLEDRVFAIVKNIIDQKEEIYHEK